MLNGLFSSVLLQLVAKKEKFWNFLKHRWLLLNERLFFVLTEKPHPQLLAEFVGKTKPNEISLNLFARDCSMKEKPFKPLCDKALLFQVNKGDGKRSRRRQLGNQNIGTNHIYIRGKFDAISICIYGFVDEVLTKNLQSSNNNMSNNNSNDNMSDNSMNIDNKNDSKNSGEMSDTCISGMGECLDLFDKDNENINNRLIFDARIFDSYQVLDVMVPDGYSNNNNNNNGSNCRNNPLSLTLQDAIDDFNDCFMELAKNEAEENDEDEDEDEDEENDHKDLSLRLTRLREKLLDLFDDEDCGLNEVNFDSLKQFGSYCLNEMENDNDVGIYLDLLYHVVSKVSNISKKYSLIEGWNNKDELCSIVMNIIDSQFTPKLLIIAAIKFLNLIVSCPVCMQSFIGGTVNKSNEKHKTMNEKNDDNDDITVTNKKLVNTDKLEIPDDVEIDGSDIDDNNNHSDISIRKVNYFAQLLEFELKCKDEDIVECLKPILQQVKFFILTSFCANFVWLCFFQIWFLCVFCV